MPEGLLNNLGLERVKIIWKGFRQICRAWKSAKESLTSMAKSYTVWDELYVSCRFLNKAEQSFGMSCKSIFLLHSERLSSSPWLSIWRGIFASIRQIMSILDPWNELVFSLGLGNRIYLYPKHPRVSSSYRILRAGTAQRWFDVSGINRNPPV